MKPETEIETREYGSKGSQDQEFRALIPSLLQGVQV